MFNKNIPNTKYQIRNTKSGFTIVEIIVVIFVIALGLLGVISLVNQNIQVEYVNKNMIVASQLAQEGLELVRNKRDVNWLKKEDWKRSSTTNSNFDIVQDNSYTIDYTGAINRTPNSINDAAAKLYIGSGKFYTHTSGATSTIFSRLITVSNVNTSSTTVTCLVQWKRGTNAYNFSAQMILYDWR